VKHWTYPHESLTKHNQIYTACKIYVYLREVSYKENEVECRKCKQLMLEYENEEMEF